MFSFGNDSDASFNRTYFLFVVSLFQALARLGRLCQIIFEVAYAYVK